jgi:uncharacterized protein (DUF1330 family)
MGESRRRKSMFYALNLFDLKDEAIYRKYLTTAGPIVQELGGDLVVMGRRTPDVPVNFPGTTIGGGQRWCIIATYKTEEDVRRFWAHPKNYDNKHLREDGTKNYIWALYEDANILKVS